MQGCVFSHDLEFSFTYGSATSAKRAIDPVCGP